MKTIRGGKGIGDALYVQAVARHLVLQGHRLYVATPWPDVFKQLPGVECVEFRRDRIDILAHYPRRKHHKTTQFEDCCAEAKVTDVELRLDWEIEDRALIDGLKRHGLPIVLVQLPRAPMGRTDSFGRELLPAGSAMQRAIDRLRGRALLVQVGAGEPLHRFRGIDVDLANRTTIAQLIDLGAACDGVLGYVSFILPLAESFGKPGLMVWARAGLKAPHLYVRQITPEKVIHRKDLIAHVFDGHSDPIEETADAFLR